MQEAIDLGFLDMHGKKTDSTSVRFTHEALHAIDALAAMDDIKRSEWIRDAAIEKLLRLKRQHEYMDKAFGRSTNTANTLDTKKRKPIGCNRQAFRFNYFGSK